MSAPVDPAMPLLSAFSSPRFDARADMMSVSPSEPEIPSC